MPWPTALLILGAIVTASSVLALGVKFPAAQSEPEPEVDLGGLVGAAA
jgi:hypothetical protein